MTKRVSLIPIASLVLIYSCSILLNNSLRAYFVGREGSPDMIQKVFGGMRVFVGDWAFIRGEEYYHRGLPYLKAVQYHHGESALAGERNFTGGAEDEHHHGEEASGPKSLYTDILSVVKVNSDSHLTQSEEKEILPWFYVEVRFNPHDIRGYAIGGYWLQQFGKPGEALKFLLEGIKNNPRSASIMTSIGWLYYTMKESGSALEYFEKARKLWIENKEPNEIINEYTRTDRFLTFDLLADIYKTQGELRKAMDVYLDLYYLEPTPTLLETMIGFSSQQSGL